MLEILILILVLEIQLIMVEVLLQFGIKLIVRIQLRSQLVLFRLWASLLIQITETSIRRIYILQKTRTQYPLMRCDLMQKNYFFADGFLNVCSPRRGDVSQVKKQFFKCDHILLKGASVGFPACMSAPYDSIFISVILLSHYCLFSSFHSPLYIFYNGNILVIIIVLN